MVLYRMILHFDLKKNSFTLQAPNLPHKRLVSDIHGPSNRKKKNKFGSCREREKTFSDLFFLLIDFEK